MVVLPHAFSVQQQQGQDMQPSCKGVTVLAACGWDILLLPSFPCGWQVQFWPGSYWDTSMLCCCVPQHGTLPSCLPDSLSLFAAMTHSSLLCLPHILGLPTHGWLPSGVGISLSYERSLLLSATQHLVGHTGILYFPTALLWLS